MAKKSARKLFLFGRYSLALLLPKKWLRDLAVDRGQSVNLEYDHARRRIVMRFPTVSLPTPSAPTPKTPLQPKVDPKSDLQPIPEL